MKAKFDAAHLTLECCRSASAAPRLVAFMPLILNLKKELCSKRRGSIGGLSVISRSTRTCAHLQQEPSANDARDRSVFGCWPLQKLKVGAIRQWMESRAHCECRLSYKKSGKLKSSDQEEEENAEGWWGDDVIQWETRGRKKSKSLRVLPFWHKHIICAQRQREEEREMRPSETGTAEIKEHYTSLLLKCSEQERKPLSVSQKWWRGWRGFPPPSIHQGTVQTSPQLRCFSVTRSWKKSSGGRKLTRFVLFKKRPRGAQQRCEWDSGSWKDEAKRQDSGCQVWKMEGFNCAGCNRRERSCRAAGRKRRVWFLWWKS